MERRDFVRACAVMTGVGSTGLVLEADAESKKYERVLLVDIHNKPLKASTLSRNTNYVFHYPFEATPCFLLHLDRAVTATDGLNTEAGKKYAAPAGVGPTRGIVAFSAICAHKLAYPSPQVSFIGFRDQPPGKSTNPTMAKISNSKVITCCADHSVYDPFAGAKVLGGPAPQPLAAISLEYDAKQDTLYAVGTLGGDKFNQFFEKYAFKLSLERGGKTGNERIRKQTVVKLLSAHSAQTAQC